MSPTSPSPHLITNDLVDKVTVLTNTSPRIPQNEFLIAKLYREIALDVRKLKDVCAADAYMIEMMVASSRLDAKEVERKYKAAAHLHNSDTLTKNFISALVNCGEIEWAVQELKSCVERYPGDLTVIELLSIHQAELSDFEGSIHTLEQHFSIINSDCKKRLEAHRLILEFIEEQNFDREALKRAFIIFSKLANQTRSIKSDRHFTLRDDGHEVWLSLSLKTDLPFEIACDINDELVDALLEADIPSDILSRVTMRVS